MYMFLARLYVTGSQHVLLFCCVVYCTWRKYSPSSQQVVSEIAHVGHSSFAQATSRPKSEYVKVPWLVLLGRGRNYLPIMSQPISP